MTDDLRFGRTRRAHVDRLLATLERDVVVTAQRLRAGRRLRLADRESLRRTLAGMVGTCETLRIWLDCGAPQ